MKIKASELSGISLDWAVAKCEGKWVKDPLYMAYHPSKNWPQGGPIIERERICINPRCFDWVAINGDTNCDALGKTPLIAAMRCYVASTVGEEVEIPDEFLGDMAC